MAFPITLPVFTYTPEGIAAEKLGMSEPAMADSDIVETTFYGVDALSVYPHEGDGQYSMYAVGAVQCIVDMPVNEIKKLIEA